MASCASCGSKLPAGSRFCPECGARTEPGPTDTAVQELPSHESGPVPVEQHVAERHYFGVTPPTALFAIGVAALALSLLLFASGHWLWGIVLLIASVASLAAFFTQARRMPPSGVAGASLAAVGVVRSRAEAAVETVAAHGSARIELARLRREAGALAESREQRLRELGEAVYEGDEQATSERRKAIEELDEQLVAKETEMADVAREAKERIERAQLEVQPTQIVQEDGPDQTAPPEIHEK